MVTKKQIRSRVELLQKMGYDIAVGWAYGGARITNLKESRDLSPRLPTGQLMNWLDGFQTCVDETDRHNDELRAAMKSVVSQLNACLEKLDEFADAETTPFWIKENSQTRIANGQPEIDRAEKVLAKLI